MGHRITGDRTLNRNKGIGWDAVHLAIDDHSRVSFVAIKPDETSASCTQFLREAVAAYAGLGVRIDRVMTDNGAATRRSSIPCAKNWASDTSAPARTRPRPMARPSASCRPDSASGPMQGPIRAQHSVKPRSHPSSTNTTGIGHTLPSTISSPRAASLP